MLERIRQSTACRVATEEVGGAFFDLTTDAWEVRDVDAMRWQHSAVDMKETLGGLCLPDMLRDRRWQALRLMFSFYPKIDTDEVTAGKRNGNTPYPGMEAMERASSYISRQIHPISKAFQLLLKQVRCGASEEDLPLILRTVKVYSNSNSCIS